VAENTGGDCYQAAGTFTDEGYNLDSDGSCALNSASPYFDLPSTDPDLGDLQNNGGPTDTMALLAGSPAIEYVTAVSGLCPLTDQRGAARNTPCDIGAYDTDYAEPGRYPAPKSLVAQVTSLPSTEFRRSGPAAHHPCLRNSRVHS
jgi:hypothetical protein